MKRVVPLPRGNTIIVIFHDPAEAHDVGSEKMLPTTIFCDVVSLAFIFVIAIFPSVLVQTNIIHNILSIFVKLSLVSNLHLLLQYLCSGIYSSLVIYVFAYVIMRAIDIKFQFTFIPSGTI